MSDTPVKVYSLKDDICELCGFSFVETLNKADGSSVSLKKYSQKLRITDEKVNNIRRVFSDFCPPSHSSKNGICVNCNRQVTKFLKLEKDLAELKNSLTKNRQSVKPILLTVPSPSRKLDTRTKRLPRTPLQQIQKQQIIQTSPIAVAQPVQIVTLPSFHMLLQETQPVQPESQQIKPDEETQKKAKTVTVLFRNQGCDRPARGSKGILFFLLHCFVLHH